MNPIVEFCISNLANGSQKTLEALERDPNIDVLEYGCLSYCTKCADSLYALVNGEVVQADTAEELTEEIYKFIEENPLF
ncbi:YuzB family protein [Sporosarcina sp. Sa2YVA2]|uniref:YuzB family protein n=1 Tax=Sporosarcina quadrami TaxID=2762234 RepID=A0ABR8UC23_9BACL|nr:YuzB family protein [Sporosarcina quadrami]MBD7985597.1 YuzB family protein [Sporosarcina quadrami]